MADDTKKQERAQRLSQALRDNLRKRKQQKRDKKIQSVQADDKGTTTDNR